MVPNVLQRSVVMVVDDHPETLHFLIDALESVDVTVLVATGGKQALDQVQRLVPDLILLDAVMPGMDGFDTCRALKSGPAADAPVIFMTGLEQTQDVVRGLDAGGIDYVTKPIATDELLARMRVHLSNARAVREVKAALDTGGRTMLAVDRHANLRWTTPQAQRLLASLLEPGAGIELPPAVSVWLARFAERDPAMVMGDILVASPGTSAKLKFRLLSCVNEDEWLLTVQKADPAEIERERIAKLQHRFNLTLREAQVLYWLSLGKSNRDIADILGMGHRTVDKHLEHIYPKMSVESRAGAIATLVRMFEP